MMELDVISTLNADDTLDTLLGATGADSKIYPNQVPHSSADSTPYIVYTTISEGTTEENLREISMQFDVISDNYIEAKNIRDRIIALLDRQDKIGNSVTSSSYLIYWGKKVGGQIFKEPGLNYFHNVSIYDFKYAEQRRREIDVLNKYITFPMYGSMVAGTEYSGIPIVASRNVLQAVVIANEAPTGANLVFDVMKNGVVLSNQFNLTAGSFTEATTLTETNFAVGDILGVKIISVGSTAPGAGVTVYIRTQ